MIKRKLTIAEKNFWVEQELYHDDRNNIVYELEFDQEVESQKIIEVINKIVEKQSILGANITIENGMPFFVFGITNKVEICDSLSILRRAFDFKKDSFIRVMCDKNKVYIATHHIVIDQFSWDIFVTDLLNGIADRPLKSEVISFKENLTRKNNTQKQKENLQYWQKRLRNKNREITFPYISDSQQRHQNTNCEIVEYKLSYEILNKVKEYTRKHHVTNNSFFMFVIAIMIMKLTNEREFVLSTPIALRQNSKEPISCDINVLPCLVTILKGNFLEQLQRFFVEQVDDIEHRDFFMHNLRKKINNTDSDQVLYNVMAEYVQIRANNVKIKLLANRTAKLDLIVSIIDNGKSPIVRIEYDKTKIDKTYIQLLTRIDYIVGQIIADKVRNIEDIKFCKGDEEKKLLYLGMGEKRNIKARNIVDILSDRIKGFGKKTALMDGDRNINYQELYVDIQKVMKKLKNAGVKPGDKIAIEVDRSAEYIIDTLAIWACNAVYVSISSELPKERKKYMVKQAGVRFLISKNQTLIKTGIEYTETQLQDSNVAYIIFTSGTTGKPKGVQVCWEGFINHLYMMIQTMKITDKDTIAQTAEVSFDISVWQMFCGLLVGAKTVIVEKDTLLDIEEMANLIGARRVTILEIVPSVLSAYLNSQVMAKSLQKVKIITTGEAISTEIANRWVKLFPNNKLLNAYGPAEASDDTHFYAINHMIDKRIPIGKSALNIQTYLLDDDLQLCPKGAVGEICIGGIAVSAGYVNDVRKTAEVFIKNPFASGNLYRTGDYARWNREGNLEFYGRKDDQIKIRGQRLELGEIQYALKQVRGIKDAAVLVYSKNNFPKLIGFIVCEKENIDEQMIITKISDSLPCYMVPWKIIQVDKIPQNSNGKTDKIALRKILEKMLNNQSNNRITDDEKYVGICEIWSKCLGEKITSETNFFEVGGDSLSALTLVNQMAKKGYYFSAKDIFEYQTPRRLVDSLRGINNVTIAMTRLYPYMAGKFYDTSEVQLAKMIFPNEQKEYFIKHLHEITAFFKQINVIVLENTEIKVDKWRKRLKPGDIDGFLLYTERDGRIVANLIIHHLKFDFYNWDYLYKTILEIITDHQPKNTRFLDDAIWGPKNQEVLEEIVQSFIKADQPTQEINFCCKIEDGLDTAGLKNEIIKSIVEIFGNRLTHYYFEHSIRNIENIEDDELGWGTFLSRQIIKQIPKRETSQKQPFIVINIVHKKNLMNTKFKVATAKIYRDIKFIEIDIQINDDGQVEVNVQTNIDDAANKIKNRVITNLNKLKKQGQLIATPSQIGLLHECGDNVTDIYKEQIVVRTSLPVTQLVDRINKCFGRYKILRAFFEATPPYLITTLSGPTPIELFYQKSDTSKDLIFKKELNKVNITKKQPLIYFAIIKEGKTNLLVLSYHHVLLDGVSIGWLLDEIISGYQIADPAINGSKKYARWQAENLTEIEKQKWQKYLSQVKLEDFQILAQQDRKMSRAYFVAHKKVKEKILALAQRYSMTPAACIQTFWQQWATRYFKKEKLVFGLVRSTRVPGINYYEIGLNINTIPWVAKKYTDIAEALEENSTMQKNLIISQHLPLKEIMQISNSPALIFDVILTITTRNLGSKTNDYEIISTTEDTGYPLSVDIIINNEQLEVQFAAKESQNITKRMAASFENYLVQMSEGQDNARVEAPNVDRHETRNRIPKKILCSCLTKIIDLDEKMIDCKKTFIQNGGDSVLAMRLQKELSEGGYDVNVRDILNAKDLESIPTRIKGEADRKDRADTQVKELIDFYKNGYGENFHEQAAFILKGQFHQKALEDTSKEMGQFIESLKTKYYSNGYDKPIKTSRVVFQKIDNHFATKKQAIEKIAQYDNQKKITLFGDNELLRIYANQEDNYWLLFLAFSAIVTDGWSFSILLKKFMEIYERKINIYQRDVPKKGIRINTNILSKANKINEINLSLTKTISRQIKQNCKKHNWTEAMMFKLFLEKYCKMKGMGMYEYVDNRSHKQLNEIGYFVEYRSIVEKQDSNLLFIFENYQKTDEMKLKSGMMKTFQEVYNWRKPLLPPFVSEAIFIEWDDSAGMYGVKYQARKKKIVTLKELKKLIGYLRKEIKESA